MTKIILGGLLLIICAAMVITLVPGGLGSSFGIGGPGRGVVAKVGGNDITTVEVERQARMLLRQQFPRGGAQSSMLLPFFTSRAAEQLINENALVSEAERMGFHATDEELRDELQHGELGPMLFPEGKFVGQEAYEDFVSRNDLTVPQFEDLEKNFILVRKLRNLVSASAVVTTADVKDEFIKRNTRVKFDYAVLRKDDIEKSIHPTDAELKAYYDSHKASYNNSIPEQRKIKYIVIDTAKMQAAANVTPDDLRSYYDQHRDEFRVPGQVNVSQILIKTPLPGPDGKVDQKGVGQAQQKADDVLKQIKAGGNFEELAKKYSEDPSSKQGGSLGWMEPNRFPSPEVQKAASSLAKGGTSDVINAGYAFVILHINDKQEAHVKSPDEAKAQIEPIIKQQKVQHQAETEASTLVTQARTQGIDKAAAAKGMQVVSTDYVSRTDALPGLGPSPAFMDAVFNESTKNQADQAQLPQGYAIFEVEDIKPPSTPGFEQIHARVESEFKNEQANNLLAQKTQELADRAKAEHDLKKTAKELGATVKTSDLVLPDGQVPDIGAMSGPASVAFTMKPGEISGPVSNGTTGAVLLVVDKQAPTDQDFMAKKDEVRDQLAKTKQDELFALFVNNLRDQMEKSGKIKINQDELKTLTRQNPGDQGE
jgi:peptidyl-prolyl cis-trans isomerase D